MLPIPRLQLQLRHHRQTKQEPQAPNLGFRLDDGQRPAPVWPQMPKENPVQAVPILELRAFATTAEDLKLVTEGDILEGERCLRSKRLADEL
jgi:hypothetical protein